MSSAITQAKDAAVFNAASEGAGKPWRLVPAKPRGWVLVETGKGSERQELLDLRKMRSEFEAVRRAVALLVETKRL